MLLFAGGPIKAVLQVAFLLQFKRLKWLINSKRTISMHHHRLDLSRQQTFLVQIDIKTLLENTMAYFSLHL